MNKLYSKINLLNNDYQLEQATARGEEIMDLDRKKGHAFYDNFCMYCTENEIDLTDISDDEFNACVELLEDFAKNQDGKVKFSISK